MNTFTQKDICIPNKHINYTTNSLNKSENAIAVYI